MPTTILIHPPEAPDWTARREPLGLPPDLEQAFGGHPEALAALAGWPPAQQWGVAWFVGEAPDPATRRRRALAARRVLEGGAPPA